MLLLQKAKTRNKNWTTLAGGSKHRAQVCRSQKSYKVSKSINHVLQLHCSPGWKMGLKWAEKCANACIFVPCEHGETCLDHLNADRPFMRKSPSACFYLCSMRSRHMVHITSCVYPGVCIVPPQPQQRDESLIPRGLLAAMTSDPFQNNNIQNVGFLQHPPRVANWKPFDIGSAHFHTYCLLCLWKHLWPKIHHGRKVFSLRQILL